MNALKAAVDALASNLSGHWGIVTDVAVGSFAQGDACFDELKGDRRVACVHLQCSTGDMMMDVDTRAGCETSKIGDRLCALIYEAREDGRNVARCVVTQFGELSVEAQCSVLRGSRAVRDKTTDFIVQTIVSGAWNYFRVQEYWKKHYDELSPAPDRKHVFFQSRPDCEDILSRLSAAKLISDPPSHFDHVCADLLTEFSGGDEFILDYIISSLKAQHLHLEAVESILAQTAESGELADALKRRAKTLSAEAWEVLLSILNHQFASRPQRDVHAEDLRLAGLVIARLAGTQNRLAISSPIVERILRDNWAYIATGQPHVYRGNDLARTGLALNTAAYRLVAQIENTIRNLIVLSHSKQEDWKQRLELVIASAIKWRSKVQKHTTLELADDSLVYFLTTKHLKTILTDESENIYSEAIRDVFPQMPELLNTIEQYRVIRDAVAHNQPLSLKTVKRLEDMCNDIEKRICRAQT